jgi:hypothetical protein
MENLMTDSANPTMKHTPEPWKMDWHFIVAPDPKGVYPDMYIGEISIEDSEEPERIASAEQQIANGRRIIAAVNACRGIPVEALEQGIVQEIQELLTRAILELEEWHLGYSGGDDSSEEALTLLHMAVEKLRGDNPERAKTKSAPVRFDGYEIAAVCRVPGHDAYEICTPSEAEYWTLYGHIPGEGVDAVADRQTKEQCEELLYRLTGHRDYLLNTAFQKKNAG